MIYVFDACAMLAVLKQESGAAVVEGLLLQPNAQLYAHATNLCEVFYGVRRDDGEAKALLALNVLQGFGIKTRTDLDDTFWQDAGRLKADWRKISLADCYGLTLAQHVGGQFVTSDHHELDPLAQAGFPITFFR